MEVTLLEFGIGKVNRKMILRENKVEVGVLFSFLVVGKKSVGWKIFGYNRMLRLVEGDGHERVVG